jgi:hypothetical protein
MGQLKTQAVADFIPFGLVHLHEHGLFGLITNRSARTNTCPVENVKTVELAFRMEQSGLLQRFFNLDGCRFLYK